jgi:hypothetical protein
MGGEDEREGDLDDRGRGIEKEVEKEGEYRSEGRQSQSSKEDVNGIRTGALRCIYVYIVYL